jgi:hypothetical protein
MMSIPSGIMHLEYLFIWSMQILATTFPKGKIGVYTYYNVFYVDKLSVTENSLLLFCSE